MLRKSLPVAVLALVVAGWLGHTPGWLTVQVSGPSNYSYHAEWAAYLAPEDNCPGGENGDAPVSEQQETMLCLLNWARAERGLSPLQVSPLLMRAAVMKADDLVRCNEFRHDPCAVEPDGGARSLGYRGAFGENIAWGTGPARPPRPTVDGWLHSSGHRKNLFRPGWRIQGIALLQPSERFQDETGAAIWVSQFGG